MIPAPSTANAPRSRAAFTIVEITVALGLLAGAAALAAELVTSSLSERSRLDVRREAVESAANILEQARDLPFDELSSEWAGRQKLPDYFLARWPDSRLSLRVEAEAKRSGIKRVTVEIKWTDPARSKRSPIELVGLFAARSTKGER